VNRGPVYLLGTGENVETPMVSLTRHSRESGNPVLQGSNRWPWTPRSQGDEIITSSSRAFRVAAAFAEAGITHNDVDHFMIYAALAHPPIYGLEDLGFVPRGEAGSFIAEEPNSQQVSIRMAAATPMVNCCRRRQGALAA
jgi:hypothetical protein